MHADRQPGLHTTHSGCLTFEQTARHEVKRVTSARKQTYRNMQTDGQMRTDPHAKDKLVPI